MGSYFDAPEKELEEEGKCELLGMFGFFIQFVLGVVCFSVLVVKRLTESPKRSLIIWCLDILFDFHFYILDRFLTDVIAWMFATGGIISL